MKPFKLGKQIRLKHVPFSELIEPRLMVSLEKYFAHTEYSIKSVPASNSRALDTIKKQDIEALISSITTFGLLNPLLVCKLPRKWKENLRLKRFSKMRYILIDGQRRYYAIKKIFNLEPLVTTEDLIKRYRYPHYGRLVIDENIPRLEDYILLPCIIYPYATLGESRRHSIEDNKFGVRPKNIYLDYAERGVKVGGYPYIQPTEYEALEEFEKQFKDAKAKYLKGRESKRYYPEMDL